MSYCIYKICCDDCPDFVYVGSTKAFRQRKSKHKEEYNKLRDRKLYNIIRENGGWDNWRMVIIEECGEISFTEARIKEEEHRVKLNANLNMIKCYQTDGHTKENHKEYCKEWYENNKEHVKETSKKYRENNKEKIKKYQTQKIICECGLEINISNKARHKKNLLHKKNISNIIVNEDSESP
jgi:hypothetical protein